ncbi:uncharacterized protein Bfra_008513 [Botrytis fragariae]|uniref:Uncharacterized protein n=1 Tax=Botrytis fragariae TaxID=1964551 RepID=A0A8H6ASZ6_9HELO|nr:uncharacterized protein Bfra_008513 [Botrytis fragariae]KAF5873233.1 hypothetical protein Bfra_008513 [Botrytis fragariae]
MLRNTPWCRQSYTWVIVPGVMIILLLIVTVVLGLYFIPIPSLDMRDLKIARGSPENVYDHYDIYFIKICGRNDRIAGFDNQSSNQLFEYYTWEKIFLRFSHGVPEETLKDLLKLGDFLELLMKNVISLFNFLGANCYLSFACQLSW